MVSSHRLELRYGIHSLPNPDYLYLSLKGSQMSKMGRPQAVVHWPRILFLAAVGRANVELAHAAGISEATFYRILYRDGMAEQLTKARTGDPGRTWDLIMRLIETGKPSGTIFLRQYLRF